MPESAKEGDIMSDLTLVTGGARSGKSRFAELLAKHSQLPVTYIATAQVRDEEMAQRIEKHRQSRPAHWALIEEPYDIPKVLQDRTQGEGTILLDCVTLWLSNLLLQEMSRFATEPAIEEQDRIMSNILAKVQEVGDLARRIQPKVILVTNEVGQGIVPDNHLSRFYRDLAGRANQILALASKKTYLVVAGYPLEIKTSGEALIRKYTEED